ncbi:aspartate/glutamate racemase family protein [Microbaculum sp. FT89]|uniref:aspartate racemase/maleate isomerase family protein n=1 Tax=Microbaculum sp. FT89 TaxID=3447298 RepID=UPI003F52A8F2
MTTVVPSPVSPDLEPNDVSRLGLIALATDLTSERDAWRVLPPERAALHVTRVPYANPTTPENLARMAPTLTAAADLLVPDVTLAAICFSCTAASVEIGDDAVAEAIRTARPGVPVVTPPDAAVQAFAALGVGRIALVTPYLPETTAPMVAYFTRRGLDVASAQCLGLSDDREMARVSAATIVAAAEAADRPDVEGVFLSCTALPALGVIDAIEDRLGKPVVSSNQASLWRMLQHADLAPLPGAPGRLFALSATSRAA